VYGPTTRGTIRDEVCAHARATLVCSALAAQMVAVAFAIQRSPKRHAQTTTHTNRALLSQGRIVLFETKTHTMVRCNCAAPEFVAPLPRFCFHSTVSRPRQHQLSIPHHSTTLYVAVALFHMKPPPAACRLRPCSTIIHLPLHDQQQYVVASVV
jgi:hypothetical protein